MSDIIPNFSYCPRCGQKGYDVLRTHSYCVECNFCPDLDDYDRVVPKWVKYRIVDSETFAKNISKRPRDLQPKEKTPPETAL